MALLLLVPAWVLGGTGCYSAGQRASRGAFDEAKTWWAEEGKSEAKVLAKEGTETAVAAAKEELGRQYDAGRKMLQDQWNARMAELGRKVDEGRASPLEIALWVLLGGGGAGTTAKLLERLLIGKRAVAPPAVEA